VRPAQPPLRFDDRDAERRVWNETATDTPTTTRTRGRESLTSQLVSFFQAQPHRWIDGRALASRFGVYAWRSRVADARRPPFNLCIENRQSRQVGENGRTYTCSEYRYIPTEPQS